jgi:hypothetical protein
MAAEHRPGQSDPGGARMTALGLDRYRDAYRQQSMHAGTTAPADCKLKKPG